MDEKGSDCKLTYIGSPTSKYGTDPWYALKDVRKKKIDDRTRQTIEMIANLFKEDNVRISFKGFPGITDVASMNDILTWR